METPARSVHGPDWGSKRVQRRDVKSSGSGDEDDEMGEGKGRSEGRMYYTVEERSEGVEEVLY